VGVFSTSFPLIYVIIGFLRIANLKGFGRICEKRRVFRGKSECSNDDMPISKSQLLSLVHEKHPFTITLHTDGIR